MRYAIVLSGLVLLLGGCANVPPMPSPPEIIRIPVTTYVPIPPKLTAKCRWTDRAPPSDVFVVAAGRRACLLQYEAQLKAIDAVEGTPTD